MSGAIPVARGCGTRKAGGTYVEVGLSPFGKPLEHFIIDPPFRLTPELREALGISPIGVSLTEIEPGMVNIMDWVGETYYPNVADFLEEVRNFGLSRRLELQASDFAKITPQSKLFLIHPRAWIDQFNDYYHGILNDTGTFHGEPGGFYCPKDLSYHRLSDADEDWAWPHAIDDPKQDEMCAGLWWQDITGGTEDWEDGASERRVLRDMPSFDYLAHHRPIDQAPTYTPAMFAWFVPSRIVVVEDKEGGKHEAALDKASSSNIPVELVEE